MNVDKGQIKKWIQELRSGNYDQASGELFDGENGYCCLGVACVGVFNLKDKQIKGLEFPDQRQLKVPDWFRTLNKEFEAMQKSMTHELSRQGIKDDYYWADLTAFSLSELNDEEGYNFDEIADILQLVYLEGAWQ